MQFSFATGLFLKQGPARREIEIKRWRETESARPARDRVSSIEQRDGSDHDAPVNQPLRVNDGGKIMCAFEFDFQTHAQGLLHQRHGGGFGGINVLHEQFATIDCVGERDHPGGENIVRPQFTCFHDRELADHVRNQAAHLEIVSNIIARQFRVGLG